jgi:hypothetical protein
LEKILDPTGTRTPTPRSSSYTDYAIPAYVSRRNVWGKGTHFCLTSTLKMEVKYAFRNVDSIAHLHGVEDPRTGSGSRIALHESFYCRRAKLELSVRRKGTILQPAAHTHSLRAVELDGMSACNCTGRSSHAPPGRHWSGGVTALHSH